MIRRPFAFHSPKDVSEAFCILSQYGEDAKVLAGGQSLVPLMNLGLIHPGHLISLNRLSQLTYIREEGPEIAIGALTTHRTIEKSDLLRTRCIILSEAAATIGDVQVRNLGTIGGSSAHFDPRADYPPVLLALDARLRLAGPSGERIVTAGEFFLDIMTTCLRPDEILLEIRVPSFPIGTGSTYVKHKRVEGGFAIVGVGAILNLDPDSQCNWIRLGISGGGTIPFRVEAAEKELVGRRVDRKFIGDAGDIAYTIAGEPMEELYAESSYKRDMVRVFTRRALRVALSRASGGCMSV